MALQVLMESLDYLDSSKQVEVFQMLIACQECKQYSGYRAEGSGRVREKREVGEWGRREK
jgi:hypothetical protein